MESWLETFARASFQRSADTAHDLKTPLNVAVLNLELLRMRLRKLVGDEGDEKVQAYSQAIEVELRRMGRIFDAVFLLSAPPRNEEGPQLVDVVPLCVGAASSFGFALAAEAPALVVTHESRIQQAFKLFFEGASRLLAEGGREVVLTQSAGSFLLDAKGKAASPDPELQKLFKLYYTDPQGNPDLSLAIARLIAETYGGELGAAEEHDKVSLRLSLPLGAR